MPNPAPPHPITPHPTHRPPPKRPGRGGWGWPVLLALAVLVYALGLGGPYNPSNGDELVYAHIARLTAASQHWLPLVSELAQMRNTKPPLLFWQAIVASDGGRHWTMAALRTPSLLYTLLVAGAVAWSAYRITRKGPTACLAACVYLAFFCTFRYGRTFVTSAPETFWLNVPLFWLLWHRLREAPNTPPTALSWRVHTVLGVALGLGLAYKSFALIAPAAAAFWCAQWLTERPLSWAQGGRTTLKVGWSAGVALGLFGLWFVFDPDPRAVWQEFVIGENLKKMASTEGYWQVALGGGGGSGWAQLLAYAQNAGLLAPVVLGLAGVGLAEVGRQRGGHPPPARRLPAHLVILLVWLAVWLLVFTLPSQRSARYVIPAMPALALLIALAWHRIAQGYFMASLLLCAVFLGALARITWAAHTLGIGGDGPLYFSLVVLALGGVGVACGLGVAAWRRACTVGACFAVYASLGLTTAPLSGPSGRYDEATVLALHGARIAVPSHFNGQFERFEFLLPGNTFVPYDSETHALAGSTQSAQDARNAQDATLRHLLAHHEAVVWLATDAAALLPPCAPACRVLGRRWEIKGRHRPGEITWANLWTPQSWLFRREWLLTPQSAPASAASRP